MSRHDWLRNGVRVNKITTNLKVTTKGKKPNKYTRVYLMNPTMLGTLKQSLYYIYCTLNTYIHI